MDEEELRRTIAAAIKDGIRDGMSATARVQADAKSGKVTSNYGGSSGGSNLPTGIMGAPLKAAGEQFKRTVKFSNDGRRHYYWLPKSRL